MKRIFALLLVVALLPFTAIAASSPFDSALESYLIQSSLSILPRMGANAAVQGTGYPWDSMMQTGFQEPEKVALYAFPDGTLDVLKARFGVDDIAELGTAAARAINTPFSPGYADASAAATLRIKNIHWHASMKDEGYFVGFVYPDHIAMMLFLKDGINTVQTADFLISSNAILAGFDEAYFKAYISDLIGMPADGPCVVFAREGASLISSFSGGTEVRDAAVGATLAQSPEALQRVLTRLSEAGMPWHIKPGAMIASALDTPKTLPEQFVLARAISEVFAAYPRVWSFVVGLHNQGANAYVPAPKLPGPTGTGASLESLPKGTMAIVRRDLEPNPGADRIDLALMCMLPPDRIPKDMESADYILWCVTTWATSNVSYGKNISGYRGTTRLILADAKTGAVIAELESVAGDFPPTISTSSGMTRYYTPYPRGDIAARLHDRGGQWFTGE